MQKRALALQKVLIGNRPLLDDLLKRKFVFSQAAEIYGGAAGLFDYGPIGAGIKNNLVGQWRRQFVVAEDLMELSCAALTPQVVLKNSGHEERFVDFMVRDAETGETFRADHLIEDFIDSELKKGGCSEQRRGELDRVRRGVPDFRSPAEFDAAIERLGIGNPSGKKGALSKAFPFNLMFEAKLGPLGDQKAYLRPETAQSIFCSFKKLLDLNNGRVPFGASVVGSAFRNEIAPRNGLLRVREFEMAEIEYFLDPLDPSHPRIGSVRDLEVPFFSRALQEAGEPERGSIGRLLREGVIANESLAYFMAKTFLFARDIGLREELLRFRQHLRGEMAHYASDCWDLEVLTSYGWVECVGLADRAAFDLSAHSRGSGARLVASRRLASPKQVRLSQFVLDKPQVARVFKGEAKAVFEEVEGLSEEDFDRCSAELERFGHFSLRSGRVTKQMVREAKTELRNVQEEKFVPSVVEPSFGIGRLVYSLLEHSFGTRPDQKRTFLALKPPLAPYKASVLPLMAKSELMGVAEELLAELRGAGLSCRSDSGSSAIGRRYARTDELGIPFAITVDFRSLEDATVTLREIESMEQVRLHKDQVVGVVEEAAMGRLEWTQIKAKFPRAEAPEETD